MTDEIRIVRPDAPRPTDPPGNMEREQTTIPMSDAKWFTVRDAGQTAGAPSPEAAALGTALNNRLQELETRVAALTGELEAARRYLRMYGQHDLSCWLYRSGPCDCGFPAALAAARLSGGSDDA